MRKTLVPLACLFFFLHSDAQNRKSPFPGLTPQKQQSLTERLNEYVKVYRSRNWMALYGLVSDIGRGGVNQATFVAAMDEHHGAEYADEPDLLAFVPERSENDQGGLDIYGCGKATREGEIYQGIAIVHAVEEHGNWFFTGWSFTAFPNEPYKRLSDPKWKPYGQMEWMKPMEELRHLASAPR
jgi:hypothetical protein